MFEVEKVTQFIKRWSKSSDSERANKDQFFVELCALLGVDAPDPDREKRQDYCFEKSVVIAHEDGRETTHFIDFYKKACFTLEAKQGTIRFRPDFQDPEGKRSATQGEFIATEKKPKAATPTKKLPWPKAVPDQLRAIRDLLASRPAHGAQRKSLQPSSVLEKLPLRRTYGRWKSWVCSFPSMERRPPSGGYVLSQTL